MRQTLGMTLAVLAPAAAPAIAQGTKPGVADADLALWMTWSPTISTMWPRSGSNRSTPTTRI